MILTGRQILARNIFTPQTVRTVHEATGFSYGASYAGYDIRLKDTLVLKPNDFVLGSSLEHFDIPTDLVATVNDKSSLARQGIFVGIGTCEPGWRGWLTLEIKNFSSNEITLLGGQPIAQIVFYKLCEESTPYDGKYQNQPNGPVGSRRERGF